MSGLRVSPKRTCRLYFNYIRHGLTGQQRHNVYNSVTMKIIKSSILVLAKQTACILTLFLLISAIPQTAAAKENRAACKTKCVTEYGSILGKSKSGVEGYSNCNNDCVIFEPGKYKGTYTGIKWQCVEYARRWLLVNHNSIYGDVDYAIDIWDKIKFYTNVKTKKKIIVKSIENGSKQRPVVGDLFIYAKVLLGTGHVAVVTAIDKMKKTIMLGEQNYKNTRWPSDFARQVDFIVKDGRYWVLDPYLIGWKHANY